MKNYFIDELKGLLLHERNCFAEIDFDYAKLNWKERSYEPMERDNHDILHFWWQAVNKGKIHIR